MRFITIIIGELVLLVASVLVFRSAWILLDDYLGKSYLDILLVAGIALTLVGLYIINYEVKCGLQKIKN
jgi:hypothetical membrane protein